MRISDWSSDVCSSDLNIGQLHSLANALLEFETLNGDEIKRVIAGEPIDRSQEERRPAASSGVSSIHRTGRAAGGLGGAPAPPGAYSSQTMAFHMRRVRNDREHHHLAPPGSTRRS